MRLPHTHLLPALLVATLALPTAAEAYTVLVVGDSLSAAYGIDEASGWVPLAEAQLAADVPDIDFVNASISGDTTAGGMRRIDDAITRFEPDLVIIELGGNDGLRGYPIAAMQDNLESMVTSATDAGAEALILGMMIPSNYGPAYTQQFANAFAAAAESTGAALVPFMLEPIAEDRSLFQRDGIHPTAEAQPLLVDHLLPAIRSILEQEEILPR